MWSDVAIPDVITSFVINLTSVRIIGSTIRLTSNVEAPTSIVLEGEGKIVSLDKFAHLLAAFTLL